MHLFAIACLSPGNCATVGGYTNRTINGEAMVATQTHGCRGASRAVSLPANATTKAHAQVALLLDVSRNGRGGYLAVGDYQAGYQAAYPASAPMAASFAASPELRARGRSG